MQKSESQTRKSFKTLFKQRNESQISKEVGLGYDHDKIVVSPIIKVDLEDDDAYSETTTIKLAISRSQDMLMGPAIISNSKKAKASTPYKDLNPASNRSISFERK